MAVSLQRFVEKDFELADELSETALREVLVDAFDYLINHNFSKLLQILYRADVDQLKLQQLLENAEGKPAAEVLTDTYLARQKQKMVTWEKYSKR